MTSKSATSVTPLRRDSLLDGLVVLTRLHHKPFSAESLTAGLPLEAGKLTPALFIRAAERAGFKASHVKRGLADIPDGVLPALLLLGSGDTLILKRRMEDQLELVNPAAPDHSLQMSKDELEQQYSGECFYLKPDYSFEPGQPLGGRHWFWDTIATSRGLYGEVLLASLLINLFALVSPLFVMNVYDRVVPNYAVETLWVLSTGVFIVFIFDFVMKSLRGYFIDAAGKRADILLSSKTFARVMDIRMSERPASVGSFASNLHEFDTFREFLTSTTLVTLIDLPFVLLFVLLIYAIGGPLAFVPLIAMPLILLVSLSVQKPLQETIKKTFTESARKHALLIESLTALDTIKGSRAEGVIQGKWEGFNARLAKLALKSRLLSLVTVNFAQTIQQAGTVAIVIAGVYQIMAGELTVGGLIACTILVGRCLAPMSQIASIVTRYHHAVAAYGTINRMMALPVERPEGHKFVHRPMLNGGVEFRSVVFSYPGQQVPALTNCSFSIRPGEKVGIIGRMGSGKSTIARLIMGFYAPTEGSILVSGTDINQLDPIDLRRNINFVPQDPMLMNGTVRENIVFGSPLSDDEAVIKAAALSGISEFLNQPPQGFDLVIGERGSNLSGGQRQAIAIARAFIDEAPMVLLDEPSHSMDNSTESVFKTRLEDYVSNRTLLLITHKTSMLSLVDRLIVMNQGQLVADGPKEDILRALAGGQS